jgi:ketosteroid isomerase-like protein
LTTMMTFADVHAGVSATISAHAQAQDAGRTEDMVALYTPDGVLEVPGMGTYQGADTLRATWDAWKPRQPQKHMTGNVVITEWNEDTAKALTDVVFFQKGPEGWSVGIVARYLDEFRRVGGAWLIARRADEYIDWEPPATA